MNMLSKYIRKYRLDKEAGKLKNKKIIIAPTLKSQLMEEAALKKGLQVKRINERAILIDLTGSGNYVGFEQMNGPSSSYIQKQLIDNKVDHRILLKEGNLNVAESRVFRYFEKEKAFEFAISLGWPVVVKPIDSSRSRGVTLNITNKSDFDKAYVNAAMTSTGTNNPQVLVEKQFKGKVYRLVVVGNRVVVAQLQERANVYGDGTLTLLELIKKKNIERRDNPLLKGKDIPTDITKLSSLLANNIKLEYVPEKGEKIYLKNENYPAVGGEIVTLNDVAHESFKQLAVKAVKQVPLLNYAGVDLITPDITAKATDNNYIICELEYSPGPSAKYATEGERVDIAEHILDYYIKNKEKYIV